VIRAAMFKKILLLDVLSKIVGANTEGVPG